MSRPSILAQQRQTRAAALPSTQPQTRFQPPVQRAPMSRNPPYGNEYTQQQIPPNSRYQPQQQAQQQRYQQPQQQAQQQQRYQQQLQQQQQAQQQQRYQQQQKQQQQQQNISQTQSVGGNIRYDANGEPVVRIPLEVAIGLLSRRLSSIEEKMLNSENVATDGSSSSLMEMVQVSERVQQLENKMSQMNMEGVNSMNDSNSNYNEEISSVKLLVDNALLKMDDISKQIEELKPVNKLVSNHNIQITRALTDVKNMERKVVETSDILKQFMKKYDIFVEQTTNNFSDFEKAFEVLEQNINPPSKPLDWIEQSSSSIMELPIPETNGMITDTSNMLPSSIDSSSYIPQLHQNLTYNSNEYEVENEIINVSSNFDDIN